MNWRDKGECLDLPPAFFFTEPYEPTKPALDVCRTCGVRVECLDEALRLGTAHGVVGGSTVKQREKIRRLGLTAAEALDQRIIK